MRPIVGDAAGRVEEAVLGGEEHFGLAERRHVEIRQDRAQVLLGAGGADRADRDAEDAGRLAAPRALPVGPRGVIEGVLQHAGDRAVVFRRDEDDAGGGADGRLDAGHRRRLRAVVVLVVERQVADLDALQGDVGRRQLGERSGEGLVVRLLAEASDDDGNLQLAHSVTVSMSPMVKESDGPRRVLTLGTVGLAFTGRSEGSRARRPCCGAGAPSALHFRKPVDRAPAAGGRGERQAARARPQLLRRTARSTLTQASACSKSRYGSARAAEPSASRSASVRRPLAARVAGTSR